MPKTAKVTFAGRDYLIAEKNIGPASVWREHLNASQTMQIFRSLDAAMIQLVAVADMTTDMVNVLDGEGKPVLDDSGKPIQAQRGFAGIELNQVVSVAKILPVIINGLSGSIDEIIDMVFDYSPELAADREWIEENATNSEAMIAFMEVLKLCYPFLDILGLVRGQRAQPTSSNLPIQNGATGHRALARQKKA